MASAQPLPGSIASAAAPALSPVQRVVDTFVAPARAFTDLNRNASWWLPFLLLVVSSLAFTAAIQTQVGWPKVYEGILNQSPKQQEQLAGMPAAQAAKARALGGQITAYSTYAVPVFILIIGAVIAGVLMGTLNFGFGGHARFGPMFALYMYASLPLILKSVLAIIALFAGLSGDSFLISNPVGTNIGYYLSTDSPKWLLAIGTSLDIFVIWQITLLVIGSAIIARVSRGAAAVAVLGWWCLFIIGKVAGTVINS